MACERGADGSKPHSTARITGGDKGEHADITNLECDVAAFRLHGLPVVPAAGCVAAAAGRKRQADTGFMAQGKRACDTGMKQ